jgi:transposase-like protein
MKRSRGGHRRRRRQTPPEQRAQLLAEFERSGLSAATFAREHGIGYSTLYSWRRHPAPAAVAPGFVQVELPSGPTPVEVAVEIGTQIRMRMPCTDPVQWVADLVQRLNAFKSC